MRYKTFGRNTGLRVSELALGTGNFGTGWGHGAEPAEARKIFDLYLEAGGNFIDTANGYQFGQAETLLGDFIRAERDNLVVATKYTLPTDANATISGTGNGRKNMIRSVEESLKRLQTDHIDLFWAHMTDGATPIEEIVRAFDDLVRAGKIHYAGLSNFPAWRIARAATIAELRGWSPIAGIQVEYSLVERTAERELTPMAEALGLAIAAWSPLGGGFLTGKYRNNEDGRLNRLGILIHSETSARETAVLDALLAVAKETGATPTHVAIAWLRHKGAQSTTGIIPILGPRTTEQLTATLGALEVKLSAEQVERLDAAGAIPLGVPHQVIRDYVPRIRGGKPELLDLPVIPAA
jgi:aryl-alcohol dehydrogenase-like predicted oxidoreductase